MDGNNINHGEGRIPRRSMSGTGVNAPHVVDEDKQIAPNNYGSNYYGSRLSR